MERVKHRNNGTMRILRVIGKMGRGGAESMIMNLYRQIDKSKVQFDFMVHTAEKGAYDEEIRKMGGRLYYVPRFNGINFIEYNKAWNKFLKEHQEHRIVHGQIGSSAAIYLGLAHKAGRFTIAHSHNTFAMGGLRENIWKIYSFPTRFVADYYFGCSRKAGMDRYGSRVVRSHKFFILHNAIDPENYVYSENSRYDIREELGIDKDSFVVGHIGRMDKQKNHDFLLDIFSEIIKTRSDAKLLLVGDGEQKKNLNKKIDELNLGSNVIMTGIRTDIPKLLSAMDVFVFPSFYEGLSVAMIEAQASGLPIFCTNTLSSESKITELVEFISLDESARHWAEKVLRYSEGYVRKNMSQEVNRAGYDIHQTAEQLSHFYKEHWIPLI